MALEELQISINGPTEGLVMEISTAEVVAFNASTNCVGDFILRQLSSYHIGNFKKIVIAGKKSGAIEFDRIGEILIIRAEFDWISYKAAHSKKLYVFDLTCSVLEKCVAEFEWHLEPVLALAKLRTAAQESYIYPIGGDVQSPDRKRTAALFFEYGELRIKLFAIVKETTSAQSKVVDVWIGEYGITYWSMFSGYLGKLRWLDSSRLQLFPKKRKLRNETLPVVVV